MDEQFDNELKGHISKVFENFEDVTADEGWMLLREKFPAKGRGREVSWFWVGVAAAAVLLILFGVNMLVNHEKIDVRKSSQQTNKPYHHENEADSKNRQGSERLYPSKHMEVNKGSIADKILPETISNLVTETPSAKDKTVSSKSNNRSAVKARAFKNRSEKKSLIKADNQDFLSALNKKRAVETAQITNTDESPASTKNADTAKIITEQVLTVLAVENNDPVAKVQSSVTVKKPLEKANTRLLTEKNRTGKSPKTVVKNDSKKIEFGIYAGTYFNYAQGSSMQLNAGGGVRADVSLFNNLKLSTGVSIAQNTLNYGNQLPNLNTVVNTGAALAFNFLQYSPATNSSVAYSLVLTNYSAKLVGLDVPLDLKYLFNPQKNDSYFSLGVSSGGFIHQSYTYQYNYSSLPVQTKLISNNLGSFYFAKTLNVAFGLGYPLGKSSRLIIEPFLKYPLSGLGMESIRFGASGINLKFDFQSPKR